MSELQGLKCETQEPKMDSTVPTFFSRTPTVQRFEEDPATLPAIVVAPYRSSDRNVEAVRRGVLETRKGGPSYSWYFFFLSSLLWICLQLLSLRVKPVLFMTWHRYPAAQTVSIVMDLA